MMISPPVRVAHRYTQVLNGPAESVFPLLCPVREADWIEGWDPAAVFSWSGVAEDDCVFITGAGPDEAVWTVIAYEPEQGRIEFIKTTPGSTVARIRIRVIPDGAARCTADVMYQHTALGPAGEAVVAAFTREHYVEFMREWEARLNHYLATGEMLREPVGVDGAPPEVNASD